MYNVYSTAYAGLRQANITNFYGMVICSGFYSCPASTMSNGSVVACLGSQTCGEAVIENVSIVIALGMYALHSATLVNVATVIALGSDDTINNTSIENITDHFDFYCQNQICQDLRIASTPNAQLYCFNVTDVSMDIFNHTFTARNVSNLQHCLTQQPTTFRTAVLIDGLYSSSKDTLIFTITVTFLFGMFALFCFVNACRATTPGAVIFGMFGFFVIFLRLMFEVVYPFLFFLCPVGTATSDSFNHREWCVGNNTNG